MMTGMFETGSIRRPLISILTISPPGPPLPGEPPDQGIGQTANDAHRDVLPRTRAAARPFDVDDSVAGRPALALALAILAFHQDLELPSDERPVRLELEGLLERQKAGQPARGDLL